MILEKTLRWIVIGAIFSLTIIPFIVSESLFFPYITGKNFAFRIIVEVMAGAWLTLALVYPQYRPRRSWILTAFTVFVLVIGLADALGAYPFKSLWSNYERMDGWVTLAHLVVYLFVAASVMTKEILWRRLFYVSLALSAFVSLYGFMQIAGITAIGNRSAAGLGARIDATFGNPIYLAVYMLFHVFIALWLWTRAWIERGAGKRLWISLLFAFVIAIDTSILFFTGTRGTIMGLLGGSVLTALLLILFARPAHSVGGAWPLARRIAVGYLAVTLLLIAGFWVIRDASWVREIGFLNRLATISATDNTVRARFINWSTAWKGVKERPLLGWGQENFAIVFDKYYDPRMYAQEPWFDRVHNIIFDWLVAGGFLGLLSYLSIFAATLWALWRKAFSTVEASILTGLLAGYFFHNFFVFDNVTSYILFITVLGYIAWRSSSAQNDPPFWNWSLPKQTVPFLAVGALALVFGAYMLINVPGLTQNKLLLQSLVPQAEGISRNLELMKSSIDTGSFGTQEAREQLSQMASRIAGSSEVSAADKQAYYQAAVSEMQRQHEESPLDARAPLFQGIVHNAFGNLAAGREALLLALKLSPNKQSILFELALNAEARGDSSAILELLKTAYEAEPANVQARTFYASALIRANNYTLSDEILAPLIQTGEAADPRITGAYLANKRFDKIATVWEAKVKAQPQDPGGYFTLAAAYYGMGNKEKAIEALQTAAKLSPDVALQAAGFIQQIRDGTLQLE